MDNAIMLGDEFRIIADGANQFTLEQLVERTASERSKEHAAGEVYREWLAVGYFGRSAGRSAWYWMALALLQRWQMRQTDVRSLEDLAARTEACAERLGRSIDELTAAYLKAALAKGGVGGAR